ncbi:MAG: ABC transporter substrate-binding protein [SAR324 cluster bacterium]|jgi:putative spermidine/putrescine transport system substrate-binding protein|nr:ABC transporter substrate-binding protein [SAR324 cluster bacterium]|tara:strand:+ start:212 stop:1303 length:1092 start_codon:yes stop_codon:yes gene_type:complete
MYQLKDNKKVSSTTRRQFLQSSIAVTGIAVIGFPGIVRSASERKIVIRDPGGPFTPGFAKAFYKPFKEATGITAVGVQGQHEPTGLIRAMVESKNYTWDMALLSKSSHQSLVNIGYLEPIDPKGGPGPQLSQIPENMRTEFLMGTDVYSTLMAYRTDVVKKPPKTWKDFWDVSAFPGIRSMRKHPFDTIEFALMADGVAPDALYPIDFDRAFRSLDRIKKDVDIWWTGGAQTSQLLKTGEVDMLYTWNGRAQVAIDDGAPVALNWNQAMWTFEGWSILKGTPQLDLCREFIEFCASGEAQARYTPHVAYGPTNPSAYNYVDPERAKVLPTNPKYLKNMIEVDTDYWGKNKESAGERFQAWLLS